MNNDFDYYDRQTLSKKLDNAGYDLKYRKVMKSTMDFSFKRKGRRPLLVLADHQTSGRGRCNNYWNDEENKSILATIVEKGSFINKMPVNLLSHLLALQICLALKKIAKSQEIKIKWPNDIMLSGKKVGGILIERNGNATLLGFGINVYKNRVADSAYLMGKSIKFNRQTILLDIINRWHKLKEEFKSGLFQNKLHHYEKLWRNNSFILNKRIFMSLKDFVIIGVVRESLLGGNITVESDNNMISISESDYVPGSCVIK